MLFPKHENVSTACRFTSLRPYVPDPLCLFPYVLRPFVCTPLCRRSVLLVSETAINVASVGKIFVEKKMQHFVPNICKTRPRIEKSACD